MVYNIQTNKMPYDVVASRALETTINSHKGILLNTLWPVNNEVNMGKNLTTEEFIERAVGVHGNTYCYDSVIYTRSTSKVAIKCNVHGLFEQKPNTHLNGSGCPQCGYERTFNSTRKDTKHFIDRSISIHGSEFLYDRAVYVGCRKHLLIGCRVHGYFEQTPESHLSYETGCRRCKDARTGKRKVKVAGERFIPKSTEVHGGKYDYTLTVYKGSHKDVVIICRDHGKFSQLATNHLSGAGCPICKESKGERSVRMYLESRSIKFIPQHKFDGCVSNNRLKFDFYLPDNATIIEYQGIQHSEAVAYFGGEDGFIDRQLRDSIKRDFCADNGITLIEIHHTEEDIFNFLDGAL